MTDKVGHDGISLIRAPLACPGCREALREALLKDGQKSVRADKATALTHAPWCDRCLALALAPLGRSPEEAAASKEPDACPRCRAVFDTPREAMAAMPEVFLKAVSWAYHCDACAAIVALASSPEGEPRAQTAPETSSPT